MLSDETKSSIKQLTGMSDNELFFILNRFEEKNIKKKTLILSDGKVAQEIYYIISGCMRLFYEKDGKDISAYFFTENMFAGAYDSFTTQQPSRHFIETVDDCYVLSVSYKNFQALFDECHKWNEALRKILEERFLSLHNLFTSQILDSPEERYLDLLKYRPDLLNRIPQHHIATFLGVTPVSLSRIRNRVTKK